MNWFKKATLVMRPLGKDSWEETCKELEEEFRRKPTSEEIQSRLLEKYWNSTNPEDDSNSELDCPD